MHTSSDIPTTPPVCVTCGTTWKWRTEELTDHYPATTWTLTWFIRGPTKYDVTAAADGSEFETTISAAVNAGSGENPAFVPGRHKLIARVAKAAEVFQVYEGILDILANPELLEAGAEMRSIAKRIVEQLENAILRHAERLEINYSIGGTARSMTYESKRAINEALDYWRAVVEREDNPNGRGKNILARFNLPT